MSDTYSVHYPFTKEELQRRLDYLKTMERICTAEQGEEVTRSVMPSIKSLIMEPSTIVYTNEENEKFAEMYDYYD